MGAAKRLLSSLRQSSARKLLSAYFPREIRVIWPEEECCRACVTSVHWDVMCQSNWSLSAAPLTLSKHSVRSWSVAGAKLLAHVVTGKYADHLSLYRQSEIYRRQGVELSPTTLGDWVGKAYIHRITWLVTAACFRPILTMVTVRCTNPPE